MFKHGCNAAIYARIFLYLIAIMANAGQKYSACGASHAPDAASFYPQFLKLTALGMQVTSVGVKFNNTTFAGKTDKATQNRSITPQALLMAMALMSATTFLPQKAYAQDDYAERKFECDCDEPQTEEVQEIPTLKINKSYKTVKIGEQVWFAENLNYNAKGSKCYDNKESNCDKYGRLYDWETAMKACPSGWHIPSNADWDKLMRYVDGSTGTESPYNSETAGKYLKATSGWNDGGNGTDAHGFSALPGGRGDSGGYFDDVGGYGYWWSASGYGSDDAYIRRMIYYLERALYNNDEKYGLRSVRCLQD
jgi:uncharacterized protein (TIGR02145 family)